MTTPFKITRARVLRALLAEIPARVHRWWELQRDRARDPFDLPQWPESDAPALMVRTMSPEKEEEFRRAIAEAIAEACRPRAELAPSATDVVILPWVCPMCEGEGEVPTAGPCRDCDGRGAITDEAAQIWAEVEGVELRRTPTPPAVMGKPCGDCAFRPGAPEEDARPSLEQSFYCHHGMPVVAGGYAPVAWAKGMPLGAMVCAGWWAARTGKDLPAAPYRPARDGWGERG